MKRIILSIAAVALVFNITSCREVKENAEEAGNAVENAANAAGEG